MSWELRFAKRERRDAKKLAESGLKAKATILLDLLREDPITTRPRFERLEGDLNGAYSRRINIQHRFVYDVGEAYKTVRGSTYVDSL